VETASQEQGELFPRPQRVWCPCGAGLYILLRNDDGALYYECGACSAGPPGE